MVLMLTFGLPTTDSDGSGREVTARSPAPPPTSSFATARPVPSPPAVSVEPYEPTETVPRCGDLSLTTMSPGTYLLNPADCRNEQLTSGDDSAADWTPDGQRLVFVRSEGNQFTAANSDVYLLELASASVTAVTNSPNSRDEKPKLSPDGTVVAYSALSLDQLGSATLVENHADWVHELIVSPIDSPGEAVKKLSVRGQFELDWSPDGSSIAVTTHSGHLSVVPLDGNEEIVLASDASGLWSPAWSPRGDWIAYNCNVLQESPDYRDVCLVSPDGQRRITPSALLFGPTPFIPTASGADKPFWNSDGSRLLFQQSHFGLITLNIDSMSVEAVLQGGGAINGLAAEGRSLLFRCVSGTIPCGVNDVLILNVATGELDPLVRVRCGQAVGAPTTDLRLVISVTAEPFCGL